MKNVALILIGMLALAASCKKDDPEPTPPPPPPPPCTTTDYSAIVGKWILTSEPPQGGTFQVVFLKNNCPAEGESFFVFKGLGETMQPFLKDGKEFAVKDYTVQFRHSDLHGWMVDDPHKYNFSADLVGTNKNGLQIWSDPLFYGKPTFKRVGE